MSGKKLRRGMKLWPVGVSILKSELFQLLNVLQDQAQGYCHFPEYTPEYLKQLTAEQLITKVVKGYTKQLKPLWKDPKKAKTILFRKKEKTYNKDANNNRKGEQKDYLHIFFKR